MDAHVELTPDPEPKDSKAAGDAAAQAPAHDETPKAETPKAEASAAGPARLELVPWPRPEARAKAAPRASLFADPVGLVAGLATLGFVMVGALTLYDHVGQSAMVAAHGQEVATLSRDLAALKAQVEAAEAAHVREAAAEARKLNGEARSGVAAAHDLSLSLAQLSQRLDKIDKDQTARVDRINERFDRDATQRLNDLAQRIDKLEKRPTVVAAQAAAPLPPTRVQLSPPAFDNVSNDVTASIDKPKTTIHGYTLEDIHDGLAIIGARGGMLTVGPGDAIPGAGRVMRIERRGGDWIVVTSLGIIEPPKD